MYFSLETLMSIIRTGQTTLVELRDLVNFAIIFLYQATLFRWLTSLLRSLIVSLTVLLYLYVLIFVLLLLQSIGKFWSGCCLSFKWLFFKLKRWCYFSLLLFINFHWDNLFNHLKDVSWEDIFKLAVFAAATEFCKLV